MRATAYEIQRCREILAEIGKHIPVRGYVKPVQEVFEAKGLEAPKRRKIVAVRNGTEYDLAIVKALQEISQMRDEDDNPIPSEKWKDQGEQLSFAVK